MHKKFKITPSHGTVLLFAKIDQLLEMPLIEHHCLKEGKE